MRIADRKSEWIVFFKYVVSGASSVALQFAFLSLFVSVLSLNATFSSCLSYVLTTIFLYLMLYHWAFKSNGKHHVVAFRYALSSFVMLGLNFFIFWLMDVQFQVWYIYSQIVASTVVALVNYVVNRLYTFA